jgi:hypothetical protein
LALEEWHWDEHQVNIEAMALYLSLPAQHGIPAYAMSDTLSTQEEKRGKRGKYRWETNTL